MLYLLNFTNVSQNILIATIGTISMLNSISVSLSPLYIISKVILTKSNQFIYLPQALIGTINLFCWLCYSVIIRDMYQIITNTVGFFMGFLQLCFYVYYRPRREKVIDLSIEIQNTKIEIQNTKIEIQNTKIEI